MFNQNGDEIQSSPSSTNSSSFPITGLTPDIMYNVSVIADDSCGATFQASTTIVIREGILFYIIIHVTNYVIRVLIIMLYYKE